MTKTKRPACADAAPEGLAPAPLPFRPVLARSVLALSVLGLLAACGGPQTSTGGVARTAHHQSRSYDPPGPPSDPWGPWITEAARRFDVPERWVREVMRQESGGRLSATSPVGAMGLMQVMPGTFSELRSRYGLGDDPYHPYDNLMAGTAYLREMYDLYGTPGFLAAYNAGPRRLEDYLFNSRGLPTETRNYVARIAPRIDGHHPARRVANEIALAAELPHNIPPGPRRMDRSMIAQLREQRQAVQPGIQMAQLPAGPVVRMDPIPDGSTPEGAARMAEDRGFGGQASSFAQAPSFAQASVLAQPLPEPTRLASLGPVVGMAPIPDGSTPEGAARLASALPRHEAPASVATPLRLPPAQFAMLSAPARAAERPPMRAASIFGIAGAHASTLPTAPRAAAAASGGGSGWSVQVGAFASENLARTAAAQAKDMVASLGSRAVVQGVPQGRNMLYRARVIGLSQGAAQGACERLRQRGACAVVAPGA